MTNVATFTTQLRAAHTLARTHTHLQHTHTHFKVTKKRNHKTNDKNWAGSLASFTLSWPQRQHCRVVAAPNVSVLVVIIAGVRRLRRGNVSKTC